MLRLLIDQDLDHDILRGVIRRVPRLDVVTALEIGMSRGTDQELLLWAARENRVLITHDRTTMPGHAARLLQDGRDIAGLIIVSRGLAMREVLNDLELIITGSENVEWINLIQYLPL